CSPPDGQMQPLIQESSEAPAEPNFTVVGASCPVNGRVIITIGHDLPSGEGVEVFDSHNACYCEERAEIPGRIFCSCVSPGAGNTLDVDICYTKPQILTSADAFCPDGYFFDTHTGMCARDFTHAPQMLTWEPDPGDSDSPGCPSSNGLPVPADGFGGLTAAMYDGVDGESLDPEGDPWTMFALSDGSGMCTPGYYFNPATSCCSPYSGDNYGCAVGQYFDAGSKRCIEVDEDGFIPVQGFNAADCVPDGSEDMLGRRCNPGNEGDTIARDEYGRPFDESNACGEAAYYDPGLGLCVETRDGCPVGEFLDPTTKSCVAASGPGGPCPTGNTLHPDLRCCLPAPGIGGSACPEGTEDIGEGCGPGKDGCPSSHYYDPASASCLLRQGNGCPAGTSANIFGRCIPEKPGVCPSAYQFDPISGACMIFFPNHPSCGDGKMFDPRLGFCVRSGGSGEEENFFDIDIPPGRLSSIRRVSPDVIEPAEAAEPPEEVCPPFFFMNPDSDCQSLLGQTCSSFQIWIPHCPTAPSEPQGPAPAPTCEKPDQYSTQDSCVSAGCQWNLNATNAGGYCTYP
ncbi:MAG: hypothetical protein ABFS17_10685, partial [Chloroflexota bacterium]